VASTTINRSVSVSGRRYSADNTETHVVNVDQGVLGPGDVGDVHVVGGGGDILQLLTGEDLSFAHHKPFKSACRALRSSSTLF
jgi:hypothetical protein